MATAGNSLSPQPDSKLTQQHLHHRPSRWLSSLSLFVLALLLVYHLHLDLTPTLPHVQPIAYETGEGQDITYGLRISGGGAEGRARWQFELGKISDDALRSKCLNSEVGFSDSWWYLRVNSGEDTHLLLASLWQASLITRAEAEAVLGKGPTSTSSLAPIIHRIPSLATLTAVYYAGGQLGARALLGKVSLESKSAPVLVGAAAVGGAVVAFSKSSRGTSGGKRVKGGGEKVDVASFGGGAGAGQDWRSAVGRVKVLSQTECQALPCFNAAPRNFASFGAASVDTPPPSLPDDWLELAVASMWTSEESEALT